MDMQLYKRVEEVVSRLTSIEEQQNQKLDEVLKEVRELKTMVSVLTESLDKPKEIKPKAQELSKVKVQK